jgi:hypothetical protein
MEKTRAKSLFLPLIIFALLTPAFAAKKMFPATRDSVPAENRRADAAGIPRYRDERSMAGDVERRVLVPVPITCNKKLPENRRYVRVDTADFMLELDTRFHLATGGWLVVNSAVRPATVQKRLASRNRNAAPADGARASSHERGTTFDLSKRMRRGQLRWLLIQLMCYRSMGRILIIEERACIHVYVDAGILPTGIAVGAESGGDYIHEM